MPCRISQIAGKDEKHFIGSGVSAPSNQFSGIFAPLLADFPASNQREIASTTSTTKSQTSFNSMVLPSSLASNMSMLNNEAAALHAYQKQLRTFHDSPHSSFPLNLFGTTALASTANEQLAGYARKLAEQQ